MRLVPLAVSGCVLVISLALASATTFAEADWTHLIGLPGISERVSITVKLEGAEEFGLKPERLQSLIRDRLRKDGILGGSAKDLPTLNVSVAGRSTGGGGADYRVEITLSARVQSPFAKERSIAAIIWRADSSDSQAMSYDPASKKVLNPPGPLNARVEATLLQVMDTFAADVRKANPRKLGTP
jgi:hypothetical protein